MIVGKRHLVCVCLRYDKFNLHTAIPKITENFNIVNEEAEKKSKKKESARNNNERME